MSESNTLFEFIISEPSIGFPKIVKKYLNSGKGIELTQEGLLLFPL